MNYNDTISYLYCLQKHGIKLGLDNTRKLLSLLGNPQKSFKAVHIAGTNGKGSASAMIASILKTAGFKTGLFTSPHMASFTERIRVDSIEITEDEVVEFTDEIRTVIERSCESGVISHHSELRDPNSGLNPTFFEFVTAMAFLYFKKKDVQWAVIETGMGGRLDATNILMPEVSVITNISCDHKEFLGNSLKEIAGEKAGIIKKGVPVVSASQEGDTTDVITKKASEEKTGICTFGKDFMAKPKKLDMRGIVFDYEGKSRMEDLFVPLCGTHQMENASVAVMAIELLMDKEPVSYGSIREGLADTSWPGRLELIKTDENYDILIDGAHNPDASMRLADSLRNYFLPYYERAILILGIMADKDIAGIMKPLLPLASEIIMAAPEYERAASPEKLSEIARFFGYNSITARSLKEAIDIAAGKAMTSSQSKGLIVITGSFYTIGDAKIALGNKGILTTLRESR
jgi:dihydrofolate synthase/folylpolyglutamate synthase